MGGFLQTLRRLGALRLALIGLVAVVSIGFFAYLATRLTSPGYGLLYADLDLKDSAQIVARLDAMGVPYELKSDGSILYVPTDQVARARLAMAELGIPHGGSVGYELFDKSDALGATNFQQGINEMRSLEGELERTIGSLSMVESARVHLVLPKRELFARETQEPSASIVLRTRGADSLGKPQIAAILNLVASAVPGLKTSRISIIDQAGTLLARGNGEENGAILGGSTAEEQRAAYETRLSQSVEDMLNRSLGYGHVRVDVNADMDFDRVTTNQESFDPDGQVVRSTQNSNEANESTQPPDQGVTVQNNVPQDTTQTPGQTPAAPAVQPTSHSKDNKTEETTNYEISKKTISQVREAGVVRRLSVAVLVDGTYGDDKKYAPRTPEELASLTKLVQSAIGYDEKRGDRVEVVNMKFAEPPEGAGESPAIFLGLNKADLWRIGETLLIALVAIVFILLLRPVIYRLISTATGADAAPALLAAGGARALPPPDGVAGALAGPTGTALVPAGMAAGEDEDDPEAMIDIRQVEGRVRASSMRKIGEIVDNHPEEAVAILRSWMYQAT